MGFKTDLAKEGRPGYDPCDMLKLYMYGCLNHIRSSRRLQKEKSIKEVFTAFVKLCNRAGLLSHESVVIDGSKFRVLNADNF